VSWAPIDEEAVRGLVDRLPLRNADQRLPAYALIMHMLCRAMRSPQTVSGIELQRGELLCRVREIGQALGLSVQKVRTLLQHLDSQGEATVGGMSNNSSATREATRSTTHLGTVVRFVFFDTYIALLESHQRDQQHGQQRDGNVVATRHTCVHSTDDRGKTCTEDTPETPSSNGKAAGTKDQRAKLEASPHWKFIASMLTWFHGPEHEHTQPLASLSPANYVATAAEIEHTLRIDMGDKKGCEHRLGTIVKHAAQDEAFWQRNLKSLRSLRKDSGNGPKWSVIESNMKAEETAKEDDDIRPPRISAAEVLGEL